MGEPARKKASNERVGTKRREDAAAVLARGGTYTEAAQVAEVAMNTIWKWTRTKAFMAMVERARRGWLDGVEQIAQRAGGAAVMRLVNEMDGGDCSVARIMAAKEVLQLSGVLTPSQVFSQKLKMAELEVKREELQLKKLAANPVSNWAEVWAKEIPAGRPEEFQKALPAPKQDEEGDTDG